MTISGAGPIGEEIRRAADIQCAEPLAGEQMDVEHRADCRVGPGFRRDAEEDRQTNQFAAFQRSVLNKPRAKSR